MKLENNQNFLNAINSALDNNDMFIRRQCWPVYKYYRIYTSAITGSVVFDGYAINESNNSAKIIQCRQNEIIINDVIATDWEIHQMKINIV